MKTKIVFAATMEKTQGGHLWMINQQNIPGNIEPIPSTSLKGTNQRAFRAQELNKASVMCVFNIAEAKDFTVSYMSTSQFTA